MEIIVIVVVVALAARAAVDAWLHQGGIFESWRERIDEWGQFHPDAIVTYGGSYTVPPTRWERWRYRLAQLLLCRICLTYHVGAFMLALQLLSHVSAWLGFLGFIVEAFAVAGVANFLLTLTERSSGTGANFSGADPEASGPDCERDDGGNA